MTYLSPIRSGEQAERPSPWGQEPGRLWSLSDMLAAHAWQFFLLSKFLQDARHRLSMAPLVLTPRAPSFLPTLLGGDYETNILSPNYQPPAVGPTQGFSELVSSSHALMTQSECDDLKKLLHLIKDGCGFIGMSKIAGQIERTSASLTLGASKEAVRIHVQIMSDRIVEELESEKFYYIPQSRVPYYENKRPFDDASVKKFDAIMEDMDRAGSCFALGQNTACVFHLMRVMEYIVQKFGRKLKVDINTRVESWHQIMLHVDKGIEGLPGGRKATTSQNNRKKQFYLAAAHLGYVRIAWRNEVMHPKATYDEAEAKEVFEGVKKFVISVAGLV